MNEFSSLQSVDQLKKKPWDLVLGFCKGLIFRSKVPKNSLSIFLLFILQIHMEVECQELQRESQNYLGEIRASFASSSTDLLGHSIKVQKALESEKVARGGLLPQLNVIKWAAAFFTPAEILMSPQTFIPFLIPANWLRVSEAKKWSESQKIGYQIFWMNTLRNARARAITLAFRESFAAHLREEVIELGEYTETLRGQAVLGGDGFDQALAMAAEKQSLVEDLIRLDREQIQSKEELAILFPKIRLPKDAEFGEIIASLEKEVRPRLPSQFNFENKKESQQIAVMLNEVDRVTSGFYWVLLGLSPLRRLEGQIVFDEIPAQDGFGFGFGSTIRISKAEKERLSLFQKRVSAEAKSRFAELRFDLDVTEKRRILLKDRKENLEELEELQIQSRMAGGKVRLAEILSVVHGLHEIEKEEIILNLHWALVLDEMLRLCEMFDYAAAPEFVPIQAK